MRIDAHQHFWRYNQEEYGWIDDRMNSLKRDFLPAELEPLCLKNEIQGTIAVQARQTIMETKWLLELAEKYNFIKGVVGWVDLRSDEVGKQLSEFSRNPHFVGVRHVVQDEPDDRFMLKDSFLRGIDKLKNYNFTYDILVFPRQLPAAIEIVRLFPGQRFVLNHIAKPLIKDGIFSPWDRELEKLASFPNVTCKISGIVSEADWHSWRKEDFIPYLDIVFNAFGSDRLMFGSDWPVCTVAASYDEVFAIFYDYLKNKKCREHEIENMLGQNAQYFYSLEIGESG